MLRHRASHSRNEALSGFRFTPPCATRWGGFSLAELFHGGARSDLQPSNRDMRAAGANNESITRRKEVMRILEWEFNPRRMAIAAGCGALALLVLAYMIRPIGLIHGPAMILYKYPLIWKLPVLVWLVAFLAMSLLPYLRRRKKIKEVRAQLREEECRDREDEQEAKEKHDGVENERLQRTRDDRRLGRLSIDYPPAPFRYRTPYERRERLNGLSDELKELRRWYRWSAVIASILATLAFTFAICTASMYTGEAIYQHYKFTDISRLPATGKARILPQEVAEQLATSGYNSSTARLAQTHIVLDADGNISWTFGQVPNGTWRKYTAKTQGVATLNAESTARDLQLTKEDFEISTNVRWTDDLKWQAYKRHFFTDVAETVYVVTASGEPVIVAPYIKYVGFWVKVPELAGVYVVHPDGTMEDLSPEEAEKRPFIVQSGRMFPEALARRIQESYQYKGGILNRLFTHKEQTQISDTGSNSQPYLMDFGKEGTKWVSTAQPYGKAQATNAIFLTDTITGETEVWHVPQSEAYTGNSKALDIVRALSMPGITFAASDAGDSAGKFEAVEPRPIIIDGQLQFMVSVIPHSRTTVTKTVIVDAEANKAVAVFNHDTDPSADQRLRDYLHHGTLPLPRPTGDDYPDRGPIGSNAPDSSPGVPDVLPGADGSISEEELQAIIDRLLESNMAQQEAIRELQRGLASR